MKNSPAIEMIGISRIYHRGSEKISAVKDVSFKVEHGDFVSFAGPSGSGKTTLVNILGCLDNPTSGKLILGGKVVFDDGRGLSETQLTRIRRATFGYIFQAFYLIPTLTVLENALLPLTFYKKRDIPDDPGRLLTLLGLEKRMHHLPGQLSGGEMQRVAIARALVNRPEVLIADEPTGNLDTARTDEIGEILSGLNKNEGLTIVMVTHNPALAGKAGRTLELRDGKLMGSGLAI